MNPLLADTRRLLALEEALEELMGPPSGGDYWPCFYQARRVSYLRRLVASLETKGPPS